MSVCASVRECTCTCTAAEVARIDCHHHGTLFWSLFIHTYMNVSRCTLLIATAAVSAMTVECISESVQVIAMDEWWVSTWIMQSIWVGQLGIRVRMRNREENQWGWEEEVWQRWGQHELLSIQHKQQHTRTCMHRFDEPFIVILKLSISCVELMLIIITARWHSEWGGMHARESWRGITWAIPCLRCVGGVCRWITRVELTSVAHTDCTHAHAFTNWFSSLLSLLWSPSVASCIVEKRVEIKKKNKSRMNSECSSTSTMKHQTDAATSTYIHRVNTLSS